MLDELIHLRTSTRDFTTENIKTQIINNILDAGRYAASGKNKQPWVFGAITDTTIIANIAEASYDQKFIKSAPLVVVLCTELTDDFSVSKARYPSKESAIDNADQALLEIIYAKENQTKIPGTQMILKALEHRIGSCWVSYFNAEMVADIINLPDNYIATEIIVFGHPKESLKPRPKKNLGDVVFYNKFN